MSECRVLIVDDDSDTREALVAALEETGFTLEQASNGAEGLARLGRGGIDVVLLDLHLPDMSGTRFLELIEGRANKPRTILLTADTRIRMLDFASGAKLLHKPVSLDELEGAVKEACAA